MSESERNERRRVVAMVGNPTSDKGRGAKVDAQVLGLLEEAGRAHNFDVIDITGTSFDDSLNQARERAHEYDYLVVEGIVGAIVRGSHIDVDMGRVTSLDGGYAVDPSTGEEYEYQESKSAEHPIDRYYAGMLSCGLDASINDRANHSHLPTGTMRYFAAVLVELTHMKRYGYHIKATLADGTTDERDIITPLLTIANSRHIGGGIEVSPYSCFSDGLLDLVWMDHVPNFGECAVAISNAYNGKLLASKVFGWKRIREIEVTRATEGDEPPVLMADGEYIGHLPFRVVAEDCALRVLVPPAVAAREVDSRQEVLNAIARDGRDPVTGQFA